MKQNRDIESMIDGLIQEERAKESNPFLSTRIMAAIEQKRFQTEKRASPIWKTIMVAAGVIAAVFLGISIGNTYETESRSVSIMLSNDGAMENFSFYTQIGDE